MRSGVILRQQRQRALIVGVLRAGQDQRVYALGVPQRKVQQRDRAIAEAAEVRPCDAQRIQQRHEIADQQIVAAEWRWRGAGAAVPPVIVGQHTIARGKRRQMLAPIGLDRVERTVEQHQRITSGRAVQLIVDI